MSASQMSQSAVEDDAPRQQQQHNHQNFEPEIDEEREPKLYVDVNVANFGQQRIIVYEGDTVDSLAADFVKRCPIDAFMVEKLKGLLQQQIDGVLDRIDEDEAADAEDIDTPRQVDVKDSAELASKEASPAAEEDEPHKSPEVSEIEAQEQSPEEPSAEAVHEEPA